MAGDNNSTKLEFRLGQDDWELYTERLELYFIANDVSAEKQVAVLLTKIGAETNKLIRDLCAPVKPSEKKFADLVILVKNHLNRKPSETMERCKFYQAHQAATETVADFVARLRNLSINCNFGDVNVALRDQLVCGLKDHATKKALFRDENLAYDSAYRIAVAMDEEEKNASATDKISNEKTVDNASINVIRSNPKKEKQKQPAPNERGRSVHRGRRQGQRYNKESMTNNGSRASNNNTKSRSAGRLTCYCCGKPNHLARECYHRYNTCNTCKKRGHLATMCRSSQKSAIQHVKASSGEESDFYKIKDSERTARTGL
ncbi:hypothetical protein KPH14_012210 [Odynerus spinipes]|uniref:CCHC-type domain-containing protein n=1 Tax=Odynerus spinipes TaxID=1348599 RepID=A0AAD9RF43_9HYME|nr:hypothetical protein KPH14_012210 [Odynerus spinipes]